MGKTEILKDDLNPNFATPIMTDYFFEREQGIMFTAWDIDNDHGGRDLIGQTETTISRIVTSTKSTFVAELYLPKDKNKSRGKIVIRSDNLQESNDEAMFKCSADLNPLTGLCYPANNPFFVISHQTDQGETNTVKIYRSQ